MSEILNILFQTRNINILVFMVSFLVDLFKEKAHLLTKKQRWNLRKTLKLKLSKLNVTKL